MTQKYQEQPANGTEHKKEIRKFDQFAGKKRKNLKTFYNRKQIA